MSDSGDIQQDKQRELEAEREYYSDSDKELDRILKFYKEYLTGVYQGTSDYDEGVTKHSLNALIEDAKNIGYKTGLDMGTALIEKKVREAARIWYDQALFDAGYLDFQVGPKTKELVISTREKLQDNQDEELEKIGVEIGKLYTNLGFPIDMTLDRLDMSQQEKLSVIDGCCQWFIEHKRNSGAGEKAIDRQRKANRKMVEDFLKNGEVGIY